MKKFRFILPALLFLLGMAGCGAEVLPPVETGGSDDGSSSPAEEHGGAPVRRDAENLISVRINDGRAELFFDLEKWDSLHGIYDNDYYPAEEINEGPFDIVTINKGLITDVCIGKIDDLFEGYLGMRDFITPTIALLMEDGSVEFLRTDPFEGINGKALYSRGRLPWLGGVVSFSYENDKEGTGGMTIFARDKDGLMYDIKRLYTMTGIFDEEWIFNREREDFPEWRYCTLQLFESGNTVFFETGLTDGWGIGDYGKYEGSYEISLAENAANGKRPGLIEFSLSKMSGDTETEQLNGTYFIQSRDGNTIEIWHSDGDHLANVGGMPITEFFFVRSDPGNVFKQFTYDAEDDSYISGVDIVITDGWDEIVYAEFFDGHRFGWIRTEGFDNRGIINYLMARLPEAWEKAHGLGMAALCTGETTELTDIGLCRDVWLGTNHPEQFVREILYTISGSGDIYEYNPVDDLYYLAYTAPKIMTADEARLFLQDWADTHPFQLGAMLEPESDEYFLDGTEYYRFYLGVERFGVIEILVHQETGMLIHLASPGNDGIELLDDYYYREHTVY